MRRVATGGVRCRPQCLLDFFVAVGLFLGPYTRGLHVACFVSERCIGSPRKWGGVGACVRLLILRFEYGEPAWLLCHFHDIH